jgi:proline dehydrogenase
VQDTLPLLNQLRAENKGVLFAYSVEVDESEATQQPATSSSSTHSRQSGTQQPAHKIIVDHLLRSIDVAADFEDRYLHEYAHGHGDASPEDRKTWVAIKLVS